MYTKLPSVPQIIAEFCKMLTSLFQQCLHIKPNKASNLGQSKSHDIAKNYQWQFNKYTKLPWVPQIIAEFCNIGL